MWRVLLLAVAAISCAPVVDGPPERQRAIDRDDGARLGAQLALLPGVVRAEATVHRGVVDPLRPSPNPSPSASSRPSPPASTAAIVVIVDDRADAAAITEAARRLARGTAPDVEPQIVVEVGAHRAELARVGPFSVERSSRTALIATLGIGLALIAGLALAVASYARRGKIAQ